MTVQNLAMAGYSSIELIHDIAVEYESNVEVTTTTLNIYEENDDDFGQADTQVTEQICEPESHETYDACGETAKPMDTIDIDFQEQITFVPAEDVSVRTTDVSVNIVQSFSKPDEDNAITLSESCEEFYNYGADQNQEKSTPLTVNQNVVKEIGSGEHVIKYNPVELGLGKYFYQIFACIIQIN